MVTATTMECPTSLGNGIRQFAEEALSTRMLAASRTIRCEYREGMLLLRGQVKSYYAKQLAQESVLAIDGVDQVVNHLKVVR